MDLEEMNRLTVEGAKKKLTGNLDNDLDMMTDIIDGIENDFFDEAKHEIRRMMIRAVEHEMFRNALNGVVETDYCRYVTSTGDMPVSQAAVALFLENVPKAVQGDTDSAFLLATGYLNGMFGNINYRFAHIWFAFAANRGHAQAQYNLGVCYQNGEGVDRDFGKALEWFERAADNGYTKALINIGVYYSNGQGAERDLTKAIYSYKKAALEGDANAMYHLALCHLNGEGTDPTPSLGMQWLEKAAESGSEDAIRLIERAKEEKG